MPGRTSRDIRSCRSIAAIAPTRAADSFVSCVFSLASPSIQLACKDDATPLHDTVDRLSHVPISERSPLSRIVCKSISPSRQSVSRSPCLHVNSCIYVGADSTPSAAGGAIERRSSSIRPYAKYTNTSVLLCPNLGGGHWPIPSGTPSASVSLRPLRLFLERRSPRKCGLGSTPHDPPRVQSRTDNGLAYSVANCTLRLGRWPRWGSTIFLPSNI